MSDNSKHIPAFPLTGKTLIGDGRGMTLRDYFAAKAMQALIINDEERSRERVANLAYRIADVMLLERKDE